MKKLIVGGLLLFWGGWCFGQQKGGWNGTGWKIFNDTEKTCYLMGFIQGHAAGMRDGAQQAAEVIKFIKPLSSWTPEEKKRFSEKADEMDKKAAAEGNFTIGQLETTASTFYDDFRNISVCWADAIEFSTASLNGTAPTEVQVDAARKAGAKSGCP